MREKSQVIFVIHTLAVGGAERQIAGIANYLADNDCDITICLLDNDKIEFEIRDNVKIVCLGESGKAEQPHTVEYFNSIHGVTSFSDKIKLKLYSPIKKAEYNEYCFLRNKYVLPLQQYLATRPDAVVITNMLFPNVIGLIALQNLPNKLVFFDSSSPEYGLTEDAPVLRLRKKYIDRADGAVFQTDFEKDYYNGRLKCNQYIIPNFLPIEKLPERFKGVRRKEIVSFCRLVEVKNIPLLFEAFSIFHEKHSDYTLTVYGDGPEYSNLSQLLKEKRLTDFISLKPAVVDVHYQIVDAAAFVSSSNREGLSNSMLEAMAIGLPSICTDCQGGGARMIIDKYKSGILVPCKNPKAMADAMCKIAEDEVLSEQLSKNGEVLRGDLSIESIGKMWQKVITETRRIKN